MMSIRLFFGLALLLGSLQTHAQPQWRFHLAFEDATGAKDTLWFIFDTTATGGLDTQLGETLVDVDPDSFGAWAWYNIWPSQGLKAIAFPYSLFPDGFMDAIRCINYIPPLTLRWDTMLFHAPYLPSTPTSYIRYPRLYSHYFVMTGTETWPGSMAYSMLTSDSLVVEAEWADWFFSVDMVFSYWPPTAGSVDEHALPSLEIFPNPAKDRIMLSAPESLTEVLVLDAVGRVVLRFAPPSIGPVEVDVSGLPAGSYFVHARGRVGMYRGRVVVE